MAWNSDGSNEVCGFEFRNHGGWVNRIHVWVNRGCLLRRHGAKWVWDQSPKFFNFFLFESAYIYLKKLLKLKKWMLLYAFQLLILLFDLFREIFTKWIFQILNSYFCSFHVSPGSDRRLLFAHFVSHMTWK